MEKIFYCTAAIRNGQQLFIFDNYKNIVTRHLQSLHDREYLRIYGYVMMPHLLQVMFSPLKQAGPEGAVQQMLLGAEAQIQPVLCNERPMLLYRITAQDVDNNGSMWEWPVNLHEVQHPDEALLLLQRMYTRPARSSHSPGLFYERGKDPFNLLTRAFGV